MSDTTRQSNANNIGETALERLCDQESVRTLSLVQRMILEEMHRSDTRDLMVIWKDSAWWKLIYYFDQLLTLAEDVESRRAQKDSAADVRPDSAGDLDDE